ncbi:DNA-directed RNA polymerase sigma-70 factor [Cellvibrio zantedeschiae]|uniref:DNA-directed RNA polymerase sigma-70 factor n=1 Tax=Cellvibrio zantedeschiae TaxID=1237077 RepID=A0ABQ3B7V5_9GAMM|nr:anti-sigma factor [Cellvibrio zantedeschiae]GGY82748.1 DNA-directed RNA polymerase sigma-70 factor [Cellvibrio zantedeschiae]
MNYLTEERKNALAAEYVLGTLHGRARIRFQALLMQHRGLRHVLWQWESRLNTLGASLPAVEPRPELWQKIQQQLGFNQTELPANVIRIPQAPISVTIKPNRTWQWLTGAATAAALVLTIFLVQTPSTPDRVATQIAVVQSEKAEALWSIELGKNELSIVATDNFKALPDQDYELWMVAADGRPPVSLGLLPKQGKLTLPRKAILDQVKIAALAVSQEPLGGSPNGQPTKVLYVAQIVTI